MATLYFAIDAIKMKLREVIHPFDAYFEPLVVEIISVEVTIAPTAT